MASIYDQYLRSTAPAWDTGGYVDPYAEDLAGQGFISQTGANYYKQAMESLGDVPYEMLPEDVKRQLYTYLKGDKHSITGGSFDLGSAFRGTYDLSEIGSQFGDAAQHMFDAGALTGYIPGVTVDNWDDFRRETYAANRDFTAAHPGAEETAVFSRDKGFDPMENLTGISTKAGSIFGGAFGPIGGVIGGAAAGWGLGSQFGESDEDYKQVYEAAGAGALSGLASGYMSDGGSSGGAAGEASGSVTGDITQNALTGAATGGAQAAATGGDIGEGALGGAVTGAVGGAVGDYFSGTDTPNWFQNTATGAATGAAGSAATGGDIWQGVLGGAIGGITSGSGNDMAENSGWSWQDTASLAGDLAAGYGQYQAYKEMQDANRVAQAYAREGGEFGKAAYLPYAEGGLNALRGIQSMGSYDPTTDPQYLRQLSEMHRGMDARSAAMGMSQSSADLLNRAAGISDLYGQSYGREYNRLADLLNVGRFGTTGAVNAALGQSTALGNLALQGGQTSGNQLAAMYGGIGDLMAAPQQYQQNQQLLNVLAANRG